MFFLQCVGSQIFRILLTIDQSDTIIVAVSRIFSLTRYRV